MSRAIVVPIVVLLVACSQGGTARDTVESADTGLSIKDAAGDLSVEDAPVQGPAYLDIVEVEFETLTNELTAVMTLADMPPTGIDGSSEPINFVLLLDADGGEFWLSMENRSDGQYHPVLSDFSDSGPYTYDEEEYPGTGSVSGKRITWTVPLAMLGDPDSLQFRAWTQKSDANFTVEAEDFLPDAEAYESVF